MLGLHINAYMDWSFCYLTYNVFSFYAIWFILYRVYRVYRVLDTSQGREGVRHSKIKMAVRNFAAREVQRMYRGTR
jgi:hypothetical protein